MTLQIPLALSALLFAIGLLAALTRSNAILVLVGIELMLGAANLNFIAFWRWNPDSATGQWFAIFAIAVAAAEAAVGLALIIHVRRRLRTVNIDDPNRVRR